MGSLHCSVFRVVLDLRLVGGLGTHSSCGSGVGGRVRSEWKRNDGGSCLAWGWCLWLFVVGVSVDSSYLRLGACCFGIVASVSADFGRTNFGRTEASAIGFGLCNVTVWLHGVELDRWRFCTSGGSFELDC